MDKFPALFVEVIIPLALPKNYTWAVPLHLQASIQLGIRVEVGFGKNKRYAGIVKKILTDQPESFKPKDILNILDHEPLVYENQLKLWEWIAQYYMCSEGEVMQAAIPANLKLSSESILIWNEERSMDFTDLSDKEFLVAEALEMKKELRFSEVQQIIDSGNTYPVIKGLIEKQVCHVWEELKDKYKAKTETYIILDPRYKDEDSLSELLNNWSKAPKQMELLLAYLHLIRSEGEVTQSQLLKKSNASSAQLKALCDKGILIAEIRRTDRINQQPKKIELEYALSEAQLKALGNIKEIFRKKPVCLLHGITSSGKTEIYMKLMAELISNGKQVLYMLPEIALTSQIIRRLQKHFGGHIAIYHSKFNPNERVEIWNKVRSSETKIVLGARSALFLPFRELGLVIIDEEHDASYKQQDPAPRYQGRDAAIYFASLFKASVLLGSATPSIESYENCEQDKYGIVKLFERFGQFELPEIKIIDIKKIPSKEKGRIALTPELISAIESSLEQKKQVILFQNRRGYSPYLICSTCGWIPHCQQCDVTLTYHKFKDTLTCHYCGTSYPVINTCAACGSHQFIQKNFGTEKIAEMVSESFPDARIARMDYDSVKGKNDHDALIKLFEQQRVDILVGTQMVVKGLDFEHVNLVGIIDADGILNFTDFRVNERAFQLMEQVSGRAGRKDGIGTVMVQVSNTHHPVLGFVKAHNYQQLYEYEISNRKQFQYPPYTRLIMVTFKHRESHLAEEAANIMMNGLKANYGIYCNGPAQPLVNRVRNQYLWEILIKLPKDSQYIKQCKREIIQQTVIIQNNKRYRSVSIIPDVDPV